MDGAAACNAHVQLHTFMAQIMWNLNKGSHASITRLNMGRRRKKRGIRRGRSKRKGAKEEELREKNDVARVCAV